MRFLPRQQNNEWVINLTPLIDVVFLLLIFFMVSSSFSQQQQLNIQLPQAQQSTEQNSQVLTITIDNTGTFFWQQQQQQHYSRAALLAALQHYVAAQTDEPLALRVIADANAPHQALVTLIDVAAELDLHNLQLVTQPMLQ